MNHLEKVVLLSDTQVEGEVGFQWTSYWKRRIISQKRGQAGIIDPSLTKHANGVLLNMRKRNIKPFFMNGPA